MIKIAKSFLHSYRQYRFHKGSNSYATTILKSIESQKGKTQQKLIKRSLEYAGDVLGWSGYAPWLYVYCAVSGSFREGWIPNNYYAKIVVPAIKGEYGKIEYLNCLSDKLFNSELFPDLAYHVNGLFYSKNYAVLSEKEIKEVSFKNSDLVVFKVDNSLQGVGVYFFNKANLDIPKIRTLGNGVFQEYIHQHAFFNEFMPSSVATIRLTTVSENNGSCSLRACYLRIGRNTDTHVKSASQIRIPINLNTGELDEYGYTTDWNTINRHPDTNIIFAKKQIPEFAKCVSTALDLHKKFPFARCIGWDLIIDVNNQIKVMEWNGDHNGIKFSEATQGPCFADLGWENLWRKIIP